LSHNFTSGLVHSVFNMHRIDDLFVNSNLHMTIKCHLLLLGLENLNEAVTVLDEREHGYVLGRWKGRAKAILISYRKWATGNGFS